MIVTSVPHRDEPPVQSSINSQSYRRAWSDITESFRRRELWVVLGFQDIKQRYRRSVLGPLWITIATAISSVLMGTLYAILFHKTFADFLPHVAVGFVFWNIIQSSIVDGADVFIDNEGLIKQLPAPISIHVFRLIFRQILFLAHNLIIIVITILIFPKNWTWVDLSFLPAIALIVVNAFWISLVIGTLATRFRDISPLTTSLVQLLFFITPIIWVPSSLPQTLSWKTRIIQLNPVFHFIEIVRAPLLAEPQHIHHWMIVLGITFIGCLLGLSVLRSYRTRIPYWV